MPDLLVKLYELRSRPELHAQLEEQGFAIGKPIGPELNALKTWFDGAFGKGWLSEFEVSMYNQPRTCFIAREHRKPVGFACYDATALGFFGPIGVIETQRGKGIGHALLLSCLLDMRTKGYGYAIIGDATAHPFYVKTTGAMVIEDSEPGLYTDMIKLG